MMQIVVRRLGETLYIGEDLQITIVAIKDEEVRLSITAPESLTIRLDAAHDTEG